MYRLSSGSRTQDEDNKRSRFDINHFLTCKMSIFVVRGDGILCHHFRIADDFSFLSELVAIFFELPTYFWKGYDTSQMHNPLTCVFVNRRCPMSEAVFQNRRQFEKNGREVA